MAGVVNLDRVRDMLDAAWRAVSGIEKAKQAGRKPHKELLDLVRAIDALDTVRKQAVSRIKEMENEGSNRDTK